MDHGLIGPGLNTTDTWRSEWVDTLVREGILTRELVPHRHNPEDLVPVIKLADEGVPLSVPQLPGVTQEDVDDMIAPGDRQRRAVYLFPRVRVVPVGQSAPPPAPLRPRHDLPAGR